MNKFTPSINPDRTYALSLVALNQCGTRCDLIWSYIDDEGDEMFIREFRDNFYKKVRKTAKSPNGIKYNVERSFVARGAYAMWNHLTGLCVRAKLGMAMNPKTGHEYTVICRFEAQSNGEFMMCSQMPYFWLTEESWYGVEAMQMLDAAYDADYAKANAEVNAEVRYYESGNYDNDMAALKEDLENGKK